MTIRCSWPEREIVPYSHEQAVVDGTANPRPYMVSVADYYFITKGNNLNDAFPRRHFESLEAAEKAAEKLNTADVLASLKLTPVALARRERLKRLGDTFTSSYGDGHPETRWPENPGRYAARHYSDRYGESFWDTYETLDGVRAAISSSDVDSVVDLDTGDEVPFRVVVAIGDEAGSGLA